MLWQIYWLPNFLEISMLLIKLFFIALLASIQLEAAIYGEDNRYLVSDKSPQFILYLSNAIAAQLRVPPKSLGDGRSQIEWRSLQEQVGLCTDQKFSQVPTFSRCSGFLVQKNLFVTAGHCVNNLQDCKKYKWAFTNGISRDSNQLTIADDDLYSCVEIVNRIKNPYSKNDFALVRFDRPVTGRPTLKYRERGQIATTDTLTVIGHPTGLPLMVAPHGQILRNDNPFLFKTDNDTFAGNSGSPVFNERTGLVEGILVDGDIDYRRETGKSCSEYKRCTPSVCKGESVVRITVIPELVKGMTPQESVFSEDLPFRL